MHNSADVKTLCIPLVAHGNTIGLMHLILDENDTAPQKIDMSCSIAEHLALAVANLDLQQRLRQQALRDSLTGLYNRRYFDDSITQKLNISNRYHQPLSLLMMDMDHFKSFNDSFGHDAGDYVLKSVAALFTKIMRKEDCVCRIGGEEIAVLLPQADREQSLIISDKVCQEVRRLHLTLNGQSLGKLSISIGIATYPEDADDADELIKQADNAMYSAKKNGRDQFFHIRQTETGFMPNLIENNLKL